MTELLKSEFWESEKFPTGGGMDSLGYGGDGEDDELRDTIRERGKP